MTHDEFMTELERLQARKLVSPATPEYLAEIDAKIDRLRHDYAAHAEVGTRAFNGTDYRQAVVANVQVWEGAMKLLPEQAEELKGLPAILDNLKTLLERSNDQAKRHLEMVEKLNALVKQFKDVQYGLGHVKNHPEPDDRQD